MIFQNNTDSDAAYLFKNAAGTTIFNVDTANNRVGTSNVSSAATNSQVLTVRTGNATGSGSSNSGDILLRSGNSTNATSGNVSLEVGAAGTTFGSINLGTDYRAGAINIGQVSSNSIQSTVNIATSTAGTQTVNIGSSSVAGNATTIRGGSTGGINLIGVTNINTTGTAATSIGNTTGNLALQGDGTVTLASSNGTNSTNITFFNTQTAGNISYRLDRSVTAGNYEICTTAATTACTAAFAPTLQQGYNNDANGSDAVIALTSNDDSIIFRNPSSGGTDSSYVLTIDQLATGATGGLSIQSAGTGNLLLITDTTATARDVLKVANGGATTLRNQTDSTAAFQVKNAADTNNVLTVDTANGRVGIGMTPTQELDVAGTIRAVHPSFVGDYLVLEGTSSNQFLTVNNNGWFRYYPLQNGANAFNIREETGIYDMFSVDTANARVAIGRGSPTATLHVQAGDNADVAAYITGESTSHTADLLQIAKSDGAANVVTVGADGAALFRNNANSASAFRIQSAGGSATLFTADTTNLRLYVGSSTTDATAILLVVDSYNGSSDPTGVAGGQYYSSDKAAFRCYENGGWKDCARASYEFADVNDEFLSGDKGANPVGTLGWACWSDNGGCGSGGNTFTESGHPGQVLLSTGSTTSGDGTKLFLSSVTPTDFDRATFIITPRTTLTNNAMRVGLIEHDTWMVSPGHGAYFGYLGAGGNWIAVTRNAGSQTTCDTGVAPGVGTWARMEIRRNGSGNYEFYINGTLTCTNTTNLPGTTTKQDPTVMVVNASTSESYIEVDYFSMRTKVLSR